MLVDSAPCTASVAAPAAAPVKTELITFFALARIRFADFFVDFFLAFVFLPVADLRAVLLTVFLDDLDDLGAADFFATVFLAGDFLERFERDFELDFVDFLAPDFLAFFVAMVCLSFPPSDSLREEELILLV